MFRDRQRDVVFPLVGSVAQFAFLVLGGLLYIAIVGAPATG